MSVSSQEPSSRPEASGTNLELEHDIAQWLKYLSETDLQKLLASAKEPEVTDDGVIHEVSTPEELPGDFAVVDMRDIPVDTPHFHQNGETEIHFPLAGSAKMSVGQEVVDLKVGDSLIVQPEVPHFVMPNGQYVEYIVGVLSIPGYNPENQIPINPNDPPVGFNSELYLSAIAK